MNLRKTYIALTTSIILLFLVVDVFAEDQNNPLVEAIKLFDAEQYDEAEEILKTLLEENPDHLMVNYFYGACRTENHYYGQKEIIYLLRGSTGESPLKTDYYLAVQYHAQNRWNEATQHYESYLFQASEAEKKELALDEKIQQCKDQINPFQSNQEVVIDIAPVPIVKTSPDTLPALASSATFPVEDTLKIVIDSVLTDTTPSTVPNENQNVIQPFDPINFKINSFITYIDTSNFQTSEGLKNYKLWKNSNLELDSLQTLTDNWRSEYAKTRASVLRENLGNKIINTEQELYTLRQAANKLQMLAVNAERDYWNLFSDNRQTEFADSLQIIVNNLNKPEQTTNQMPDSLLILQTNAVQNVSLQNTEEDEQVDELIYKIQIGAYSRGLPSYIKKQFDKLSYIRKIENYTDDRGVVVYTTGNLSNLDDAVQMQNQVRQEGIEDAFVVPYFNGKRITLKEAKKLEEENDN